MTQTWYSDNFIMLTLCSKSGSLIIGQNDAHSQIRKTNGPTWLYIVQIVKGMDCAHVFVRKCCAHRDLDRQTAGRRCRCSMRVCHHKQHAARTETYTEPHLSFRLMVVRRRERIRTDRLGRTIQLN